MTYVESVILQNAAIRQKYDDETSYQRRLKKQHEDIFNKIEILKIINTTLYVIYNILTVPLAYTLVFVQGGMFIPYRIAILVLFVLYPFVVLSLERTLYVFGKLAFAIMTGTPFSDENRTPLTHFGDYPKSISNVPFKSSSHPIHLKKYPGIIDLLTEYMRIMIAKDSTTTKYNTGLPSSYINIAVTLFIIRKEIYEGNPTDNSNPGFKYFVKLYNGASKSRDVFIKDWANNKLKPIIAAITIMPPSETAKAPVTVTATAAPAPAIAASATGASATSIVPRAKSSYTTEVISSYLKLV